MYIISLAHQLYSIFIVLAVPCKLKADRRKKVNIEGRNKMRHLGLADGVRN